MAEITYDIEIVAPTSEVYEVVSTLGGLRSWLTTGIQGDPAKGGELRIGFGEGMTNVLRVEDAKKNKSVSWKGVSSTFVEGKDWVGTTISFKISEGANRGTVLSFAHTGWKENAKSFAMGETRWKKSLASLKKLCETGAGSPETPKRKDTKKASGWFPVS